MKNSIPLPSFLPARFVACLVLAAVFALVAMPLAQAGTIWDGGGANTDINTLANWDGDALPVTLTDGTQTLTFGTNGATATINTDVNALGLVFNRDAAFTIATGDGNLTIGTGGITNNASAITTASRTYTINEGIILNGNQTWSVNNKDGTILGALTVGGVVSGSSAITKTGNGTLTLSTSNTYSGGTILRGTGSRITLTNISGLGSGNVTIESTSPNNGAFVSLNAIGIFANNFNINGQGTGNGAIQSFASNATLSGLVTLAGDAMIGTRTTAGNGNLTLTGGITSGGTNRTLTLNTWGNATQTNNQLTIRTNSVNLGTGGTLDIGAGIQTGGTGIYNLNVGNNTWGTTIVRAFNSAGNSSTVILNLGATNALGSSSSVLQLGNGTTALEGIIVNLNGYNQTIGGLRSFTGSGSASANGTRTVTSATAATLTIDNSSATNYLYDGVISGNLSLVKNGTGAQTLSGSSANTYTGTTTVSAGTLTLNKTSEVVAVGGDLVLNGSSKLLYGTGKNEQIADTASITINGTQSVFNGSSGGNITGANTFNETIASLTVRDGQFNTGTTSNWTVTGAGVFDGSSGDARFAAFSGSSISFNSLSLTAMNGTEILTHADSFVLGGNQPTVTTLTVGSGGLTLNGSTLSMNLGSVASGNGSRLILNGNITTTGSSASFIGSYNGTNGTTNIQLSSTAGSVDRTITTGSGANLTIGIAITNGNATTAGIIKDGLGTLTLSSNNTFTGGVTINAGTLQLGTTGRLGGGSYAGDIINNGAFIYSGTNNQTLSGSISGSGALTHNGSSTLTLNGSNTYTGTTTISAGTLQIGAGNTTGSISSSSDITNNGTLAINRSNDLTLDNTISGSGALTKAGNGTFTLNGSNSYTGTTTVSAGALDIQNNNALGTTAGGTTVASGAALQLQGNITVGAEALSLTGTGVSSGGALRNISGNNTFGGPITIGGATTINSNSGLLTLSGGIITTSGTVTFGGAASHLVSGNVSGSAHIRASNSTVSLTLNGTNTFTGNLMVDAGTVTISSIGNAGEASAAGAGSTISISSTQGTGTLVYTGSAATSNKTIALSGGPNRLMTITQNGTGLLKFTSNVTNVTSTSYGFRTLVLSGSGLGEMAGAIVDAAPGATMITSTVGSGNTTLTLASAGGISANSTSISGTGIANGTTITALSGNIATLSNATTGNVTQFSTVLTIPGVINPTGVTKSGAGTWTLSGNNTYTGATTVSAGTLALSGSLSGSNVTVNGTTAVFNQTSTGGITGIGTTFTLTSGNATLAGNNTYTGATTVTAGTLVFQNKATRTGGSLVTAAAAGTVGLGVGGGGVTDYSDAEVANLFNSTLSGFTLNSASGVAIDTTAGSFTQSTALTAARALTKLGNNTLTLSGANTYTGTTTINAGNLTLTGGSAISDSGAVTLANTAGAVLHVAQSETIGNLSGGGASGGDISIAASQSLTVNATSATTFSGRITGDGGLIKNGAATLTISGNNAYTGGTTINNAATVSGSTLSMGSNNALGNGALTINASGWNTFLRLNGTNQTITSLTVLGGNASVIENQGGGNGTMTFNLADGVTSNSTSALYFRDQSGGNGTLALVKTGNGTLDFSVLNASNAAYSGGLTVNGGTFSYNSTGTTAALGSGSITLGGGTLNYTGSTARSITNNITLTAGTSSTLNNAAGTITVSSIIGGSGNLTKSGAGTLTLSGNNTYTGATSVNAGELTLTASTAVAGTSSITVSNGARLLANVNAALQGKAVTLTGNGTGTGAVIFAESASNTSNATFTLAGNAAIRNNAYSNLTLANAIGESSAGSVLTLTGGAKPDASFGGSAIYLNGNNTFSGGLVIDSVKVLPNNSGWAGAGNGLAGVTLQNGGGIDLALASRTIAGNLTMTDGFIYTSGNAQTFGAANFILTNGTVGMNATLTGSGSLIKTGAGRVTMNRTNSNYTGATMVNEGTLIVIGNAYDNRTSNSSALTIATGATVNATNTGSVWSYFGSLEGNGTLNHGMTGARNSIYFGYNNSNTTFSGRLNTNNSSNAFVKVGTGALTLSGNNTGSIGDLKLQTTNSSLNELVLGHASASGNMTLGFDATGTVSASVAGVDVKGGAYFTTNGSFGSATNTNDILVSGAVSLGDATRTITVLNNTTFSGVVSGNTTTNSGLTKVGTGTLTLSSTNTYTGATTVNAGMLNITGDNSASATAINSGGTLIGTGTAGAVTVNSGGSIGAGNAAGAVGTLTVGNITLNGGGGYAWDLGNVAGAAGTNWDLVTATSTTIGADSTNKFTIYLNGNPTGWSPGTNYASGWNILQWGTLNSTFDANAFVVNSDNFTGATPTGTWTINSTGGYLNISYTAPAAMGIWTAAGGNWTTAANWQGSTLPSNTSPLEFSGSGGVSTNDNLLNTVAGITFNSGAGSYTLNGTALTIRSGGITNNSTNAQTVAMNITMGDSQTFNAGAANLTVSGAIANAGFNLEASGNNTVSISGNISGSGGVQKTGTGTLALSGNNTYTGATTINSGTLEIGSTGRLGGGSYAGNIVNSGTFIYSGTNNQTLSGIISGSGALTQNNSSSTLTLTGNNTYTGTTTINAGTLLIADAGRLGGGSYSGNIVNNGTFIYAGNNSQTLSGIISGSGALTKNASATVSTLTLSGNNTYTGITTIHNGTIAISHANALGATGAGNGTTINAGGVLQLSNNINVAETITLNSTGIGNGGGIRNTSGNNTISGAITSGASSRIASHGGNLTLTGGYTSSGLALSLGAAAANTSVTVRDNVINLGAGGFTAFGTTNGINAVVLGVAGNTFGSVNINYASTLRTDVANAWNPSATLVMGSTSGESVGAANLLNLNGNSQAFASLTSYTVNSTSTINSASAATLTVNGTTTSSTYNGTISGAISLVKAGSSTQTLAGTNSYTGATTINGGTLVATNLQSSSGVTVNSGGTISVGSAAGAVGTLTVGNITLNGGGGYAWDLGNVADTAGTNWDLITATSTTIGADSTNKFTIYLSGSGTGFSPGTNYASGWNILQWGTLNSTFDANAFVVNSDNFTGAAPTGTWTFTDTGAFLNLSYTAPAATGNWTVGSGNWSNNTNWSTVPQNTSPLEFSGAGGVSTNDNQLNTVAGITFTSGAGAYTLNGTALTIRGGGITNNSTSAQTVAMDITMGDAQTFNAGAANLTVSGAIANSGSNLEASGNNTVSISGNISGSGGVAKAGTGTLILSGNNTYTGATTINAGTLEIGSTGRLGGGTYAQNISNNGTFLYSGTNNQTLSGIISSSGAVTQNNSSSTLILSGNNTYTGATTINAGTVTLSGGAAIANNGTVILANTAGVALNVNNSETIGSLQGGGATGGNVTIASGQTLNVAEANTNTFSGSIQGDGGFTKSGAGSLTLSGNNTYTGGTTITNSHLYMGANNALGNGALTFNPTATARLNLNGTNQTVTGLTVLGSQLGLIQNEGSSSSSIGTITFNLADGVTSSSASNFFVRDSTVTTGAKGKVALLKTGNGTLDFSTFNGGYSGYSGGLTVNGGTFSYNSTAVAGALGSGNITLGGGTLNYTGSTAQSITNNITLTAATSSTLNNANSTITVSGTIAGSGNLIKSGAGTLTLSAANTYNGTTTVTAGTLALGANNVISDFSNLIINGGTFDISTYSDTVGVITMTNGSLIGTSGVLTGSAYNITGGTVTAQLGGGTLIIGNGTTDVGAIGSNVGLSVNGSSAVANLTANVSALSVSLNNGGSITGSFSLNQTGGVTANGGSIASNLIGTGGVTMNGTGNTLTLAGINTYTGATNISAGNLSISGAAALGSTSGVNLADTTALIYTGSAATLNRDISVTGTTGSTGTIRNESAGLLTLSGTLSKNGTTLALQGGSGGITVSGSIVGSNANSDLVIDGGSVTLAAANTYNGPTTIKNGATLNANITGALPTANGRSDVLIDPIGSAGSTLVLGASQSIASLSGAASSNVTLGSNTLTIGTTSGSTTYAGRITGGNASALVKDGASTQVLTGNNTGFTGTTTVNGTGTLTAAAAGALGGTTNIDVNGGSLLVAVANAVNSNANINLGGGTLAVSGNFNQNVGLLTLSADSIIDLNGFTGILRFGGVGSWASSANLAIWNWKGLNEYGTPVGDGVANRKIVFADNTGLSNYLDRISFYSGSNNSGFAGNAFQQSFSESGFEGHQIIAVPETETYITGVLLLLGFGIYQLRLARQGQGLLSRLAFLRQKKS